MNKDIVRWALRLAEIRGRYSEGNYIPFDQRPLVEFCGELLAEMEQALGLERSASAPDPQDIDFHTLQPTSQVAS